MLLIFLRFYVTFLVCVVPNAVLSPKTFDPMEIIIHWTFHNWTLPLSVEETSKTTFYNDQPRYNINKNQKTQKIFRKLRRLSEIAESLKICQKAKSKN